MVPRPACPGCGGRMQRWGGYWRFVRSKTAARVWFARVRCAAWAVSHALVPAFCFLNRLDVVEVIGGALAAGVSGRSDAAVAAAIDVPATTVRGWRRRHRTDLHHRRRAAPRPSRRRSHRRSCRPPGRDRQADRSAHPPRCVHHRRPRRRRPTAGCAGGRLPRRPPHDHALRPRQGLTGSSRHLHRLHLHRRCSPLNWHSGRQASRAGAHNQRPPSTPSAESAPPNEQASRALGARLCVGTGAQRES
jgi:hypothetical protein